MAGAEIGYAATRCQTIRRPEEYYMPLLQAEVPSYALATQCPVDRHSHGPEVPLPSSSTTSHYGPMDSSTAVLGIHCTVTLPSTSYFRLMHSLLDVHSTRHRPLTTRLVAGMRSAFVVAVSYVLCDLQYCDPQDWSDIA
eukprot:2724881-Rhodomonas_salina.4